MYERDGARLGRYDLIAALPREDQGDVYLAAALGPAGFNPLAVLKELRPALAADGELVAKFLDEGRRGARLNHANIAQVHEVGLERGRPFVAKEYLEGQTLARVIERVGAKDFPRALWLRVLVDVLAGLHHAHEAIDEHGVAPPRGSWTGEPSAASSSRTTGR